MTGQERITVAETKRSSAIQWWLIQQHDEFKVEQSSERPSTETEKGQRMKRVHGPFKDKAQADRAQERFYGLTLKGRHEKAAR